MRYLVVLLVLLTGCAPQMWVKPGGTNEAFQADAYDCERDAAPMQNRYQAALMIERCLQVKGWRKQE